MNILDEFPIPEVAREALKGMQSVEIEDGVSVFSGHDQGVAYRFFVHAEYNKQKSRSKGYEVFDEIEMIEWLRDKRTKPTEQVRFLPDALLEFNDEGQCISGRYSDSYNRFKEGRQAAGMPLSKWGVLSEGECASLAKAGIFTIEQLAEQPRSKIESKYPVRFIEALERAIQWVYGQEARESAFETSNKVDELLAQNQVLQARLAEMEEKTGQDTLAAIKEKSKAKKKAKK